ncbi:sortase B [Marvinbryantia formatexigens]|nr:sortase B [Marvinbryantia formatexigens]
MRLAGAFLRAANALVSFVVALCLCTAGLYSVYALWDNNRVYSAAEDVRADMMKLKPVVIEDNGASFEELLAVNPDVCAWVTIDNTNIDYPVLQGATNLTYINTDVYGNFAMAGSIFLDSRSDRGFGDTYSLLYGHHMANGNMFGDLDKFEEETFFRKNKTGTLILPDRTYDLEIYACMLVTASENAIFDPQQYQDDINSLLDFVEQNALYYDADTVAGLRQTDGSSQILALSTCSSEFTDARTIILTVMKPRNSAD